ncbi:2-hydroxyacyl-CoA dehydratase [Pseudolactococcus yaeyamensis]
MKVQAGLDVGSTTVKLVIIDEKKEIIFSQYKRHFSDVQQATTQIMREALEKFGADLELSLMVTGSAGMGIAEVYDLPFIQEVIACTEAVEQFIPQTDVVIELGGEDSKITFLGQTLEQRMNGTCAGGTGAFIDQMANLLNTDATGINELAKEAQNVYPIASRCGVFAKTDVQPLINQGARKEDISASILQAVVNQAIASLASGRKIVGNVAFLGGPLYFLSELREHFIKTLKLTSDQVIFPENALIYVALGAAVHADNQHYFRLADFYDALNERCSDLSSALALEPLFENKAELAAFRARHNQATAQYKPLTTHIGPIFLGIDAGSTTTKVVAIDDEGSILFDHYGHNQGQPLETVIEVIQDLYAQLPENTCIGKATVTGYGEELIRSAIQVDIGTVETMAHYKAANRFQPGVDFILDIGGQDMKAMTIKNGVLSSIQLNEACSSGCGSFIETFAHGLNYEISDFADAAVHAKKPADLGSKCTVFMNSKVKQVQKEGFEVGDISAGLAYSVIKNALYKVIKVRRPEDLGKKIITQGGTFYNEAVLRAFEKIAGVEVVRPSISGLMGAYGSALIALDNYQIGEISTLLNRDDLTQFEATKAFSRCKLCENNCALTLTLFSDGRRFVSGNRCERGAGIELDKTTSKTDLVEYRYKKLFGYRALPLRKASRGVIGIPRALNIYDNYPLWHTILTDLGFRVQLSPRSDKAVYEQGIETIPSDTVCYPAKITHGHVQSLINQGITNIFFPSVVYEVLEHEEANNHYNCYVVQGYPNLIRHNIDEIVSGEVAYHAPVINLADRAELVETLIKDFPEANLTLAEVTAAVAHGFAELEAFKQDLKDQGEQVLAKIVQNGERGIILAGRPYHVDPEINHGISKVIAGEGFHVLTEDSVYHLGDIKNLRVVNQWEYGSRLFAAAKVAALTQNLELVQLNSFSCGLDSIATDQLDEILEPYGKVCTVLKIDEGANLGAVKIRLRSLKAAIEDKEKGRIQPALPAHLGGESSRIQFTQEMKARHTILIPSYAPLSQNGLQDVAFRESGYHVEILPAKNFKALDIGLRYVNNEYCHPPIDYVGQLVEALQSGQYDLDNTSIFIMDPGIDCSCRGANFFTVLEKAIKDAGFGNVPVVPQPFAFKNYETDPEKSALVLTLPLMKRLLLTGAYSDLFGKVVYRTRPYEIEKGFVNRLQEKWLLKIADNIRNTSFSDFRDNMHAIIHEFDTIPLTDVKKLRVGMVGDAELTVPFSKNTFNIATLLEEEGVEVVVPGMGFFGTYNIKDMGEQMTDFAEQFYAEVEKPLDDALRASKRFDHFYSIFDMQDSADDVAPFANYKGTFGFMTGGKMIELLKDGIDNIVLYQAFSCSINYVSGVGINKALKHRYPKANIVNIDYDPGMSMVNQVNRIRLMISAAEKQAAKVAKALTLA